MDFFGHPAHRKSGTIFRTMKHQDLGQRVGSVFTTPTAVVACLLAAFWGVACRSSDLKTTASNEEVPLGGQAGNVNNGGTTSGTVSTTAPGFSTTCAAICESPTNQGAKSQAICEVDVTPKAIRVQIDTILLARWSQKYCAIKFTVSSTPLTRTESRELALRSMGSLREANANYQSYYQPDGSGDFSGQGVIFNEAVLAKGPWGIGIGQWFDTITDMKCGPLKLTWTGRDGVHFPRPNEGDGKANCELAPTAWTAISQVNVFDPRLKWYHYDEARRRLKVPISGRWSNATQPLPSP